MGPGFDPVWQHTFVSPPAFSRRAVVSYWRKYENEVLVNRLGGLSLPRKSVVRLTDRPDMTLDVYRGRKTTIQQQQHYFFFNITFFSIIIFIIFLYISIIIIIIFFYVFFIINKGITVAIFDALRLKVNQHIFI